MHNQKTSKMNFLLFLAFMLIFGIAFLRLHVRIHTTLVGYDLGTLKAKEAALLESQSYLKMELAKISTKEHLSLVASSKDDTGNILESLASN